jgi:hypothetical protein
MTYDLLTGRLLKPRESPSRLNLFGTQTTQAPTKTAWDMMASSYQGDMPLTLKYANGQTVKAYVNTKGEVWSGNQMLGTYDRTWRVYTPRAKGLGTQLAEKGKELVSLAFKPFEYFQEYVAKPFAVGVTAPAWTKTWWESKTPEEQAALTAQGLKPGELGAQNAWEFTKGFFSKQGEFRQAYEKWQAPKFVKGAIETLPWFILPSFTKIADLLGGAGKVGAVAAKGLTPYVLLEKGMEKVINIPIKAGEKLIKNISLIKKVELPSLAPSEAITAEIQQLHPERLRGYGKVGLPFITATQVQKAEIAQRVEPLFRAMEVEKRYIEEVSGKAMDRGVSTVARLGDPKTLFQLDDNMVVKAAHIVPKTEGASMGIYDVLRNPSQYRWTGAKGREARIWAEQLYQVYGGLDEFTTRFVKRTPEGFGRTEEKYVHSQVIAKKDTETGKVLWSTDLYPGGAKGGLASSFKLPVFKTQAEGIKAGYVYADPLQALAVDIKERYNMAMFDRMEQYVKPLTQTGKERISQDILDQVKSYARETKQLSFINDRLNRVRRGEILPWQTMRAIESIYPDAGRAIRFQMDKRAAKFTDLQRHAFELENRLAAEVEASARMTEPIAGGVGKNTTIAIGSDPLKRYSFKFEVIDADKAITSHTSTFTANPEYPKDLQARLRERAAPREQIERIARELDPDALLVDTHRLDSGPMILGADNIVESGNGRIMAVKRAIEGYPERYQAYRQRLENTAELYGLKPEDIKKMKNPVLVRRRITEVPNRAEFAREANLSVATQMSPVELAFADAQYISEESLGGLVIEGKTSLTDALQDTANASFVARFMANIPVVDKGQFLTSTGSLSKVGLDRIGNAILAKAFPGRFGLRLAELNIEATEVASKNVIAGLAGASADLAKLTSAINRGQLSDDYHIALDLAEASDRFIRNKLRGLPIEGAMQPDLFEPVATPIQQALIRALDKHSRSSVAVRDFIRQYTQQALGQPAAGQVLMPGFERLGREQLLGKILGEKIPESPVLKPVVPIVEKPIVATEAIIPKAEPWTVGTRGKVISFYADTPVGKEGEVVKSWTVAAGTHKGQVYATLDFGANLSGQRLRRTFPIESLEQIEPVIPKAEAGMPEVAKVTEQVIPPKPTKAIPAEPEWTLGKLIKDVKARLTGLKAEAKAFVPIYREAREKAYKAAFSEGRVIDVPRWMSRIVPDNTELGIPGREIARRIEKIMNPERAPKILTKFGHISRGLITLQAALDTSLLFMQGSLVLGHDVAQWAEGRKSSGFYNLAKEMVKSMWNPKYQDEFIASKVTNDMIESGLIVQKAVDYLNPDDIETLMRKGGKVGGFFGNIFKGSYGRAGAGFGSGSLAARVTIFNQMKESWVAEGHSLVELAEFANKITGVISSKELGVSATRRAIESATLFAPNYTRAYLMVARDVFRGNKTASEVRKALAGMTAAGVLGYVGLCEMIGQEPKLNPAPKDLGGDGADFMTFKIGNSTIGVPGFWYSALRMMAGVTAAAQKDPERLLSLDSSKNDFLKFWTGRLSPLMQVGREIITQRDFMGRRLKDPGDWVNELGSQFLTFAAQNLVLTNPGEEQDKGIRFGAEIFGLRTFPTSDWTKLKALKEQYAKTDFDKPFDQLNQEQKDKLLAGHNDYKLLNEQAKELAIMESGEDVDIQIMQVRKTADAIYNAGVEQAAQSLLQGGMTYRDYLDAEASLHKVYKGMKFAINEIKKYDPAIEKSLTNYLENRQPEDKAVDEYWDEETDELRQAYLNSLDSQTRTYVQRNRDSWVNTLPPTAQKLARLQVAGRDIVQEYYALPQGAERLKYRRANPTVDAWLLVMGRVTDAQTQMATTYAQQLLLRYGLPGTLIGGSLLASLATSQTQAPGIGKVVWTKVR